MSKSPVAAGGIASVSYIFRSRQARGRWSSLWLSHPVTSGLVSFDFHLRITRSYDGELTLPPLHSAVWTFLPPSLSAKGGLRGGREFGFQCATCIVPFPRNLVQLEHKDNTNHMRTLLIVVAIILAYSFVQLDSIRSKPTKPPRTTPTPTLTPTPTPIPLPALVPGERALHVPVLLYHYVGDNPNPQDRARETLSVPPGVFEEQLRTLRDNGYTSISFDELADALEGKGSVPALPVILTFDDGYLDFYHIAWPILQSFGVKATVFIPTGLVGSGAYMTWPMIEEISRSTQITIAAHSVTHTSLPSLGGDQIIWELTESKRILEEHIGKPVAWFAYPYGFFDDRVVTQLKRAGFRGAVTTLFGAIQYKSRLYHMPRIRAGRRTGNLLL